MAFSVKRKPLKEKKDWYFYVDEKRVIKVPNSTSMEGDDVAKYYAKKKLKTDTAGGYTYENPKKRDEDIKIYEVSNKDKKEAKKFWELEAKKPFNPATTPIYYLESPEENGLTPEETQKLWQYGVDTGIVWNLQGWYGRTAQDLLDRGYIDYPKERTYDYYGNKIPTQKEVKQGHLDN